MAYSQTKLARALSAEELHQLCERLAKEPQLTGARIQEIASELGVEIGKSSAAEFRNKEFAPWLAKLSRQRQLAQFLSEQTDPGSTSTIADAAAGHLSQQVFEFLIEGDIDLNLFDEDGLEKANVLSKILQRLRSGDHRQKELAAKLAELERRQREAQEAMERAKQAAAGGQGMTERTLEEIQMLLGWSPPQK